MRPRRDFIGRALGAGGIFIHNTITLVSDDRGDAISWKPNTSTNPAEVAAAGRWIQPPDNLLTSFIKLYNATSEDILKFARTYGVLRLSRPMEYEERNSPSLGTIQKWREDAEFSDTPSVRGGLEPVEKWREIALTVRGILNLAITLYENRDISEKHILGEPPPASYGPIVSPLLGAGMIIPPLPKEKQKRVRIGQLCIELALIAWLRRFPSSLSVRRNRNNGLEAILEYRYGLMSVIALQMMQAVARQSAYICAECRRVFIRGAGSKRAPRSDRKQYCEQCADTGAIAKNAEEKRGEKMRRARQMYQKGQEPAAIAEELKLRIWNGLTGPERVERWAKKGRWDVKKA